MAYQKSLYEKSYTQPDFQNEFGMPDPKINDGKDYKNQKILNLGSGTSNDMWFLARHNIVVGVDYSATGLKVGLNNGVQATIADLNQVDSLPFASGTFDLVVCKDILEHLLDPLALLIEVRRILKASGYLVISVPNNFYFPYRLRILFGENLIGKYLRDDHTELFDEWNYMHIRFFTFRGFQKFIRVAGFQVDKWFWDFGMLAHYNNPDMWFAPQLYKLSVGQPLSKRAKFGMRYIRPLWRIYNLFFPPGLRSKIVSISPGLLCAGFYVRVRKS